MSAPIFVIRLLSTLSSGKKEATTEDPIEWMLFQDGVPFGPVGRCALKDVYHILEDQQLVYTARLVLLLPAEDVVLTRVQIPPNQKRQRNKLVPYILEEHLNQSVSDVFFVSEWLAKTSDVGVAYITKERLGQWLKLFEEQNLRPDVVFPEHYLLPYQKNQFFAIFDQGRVLVRHDSWVASVTPVAFAQEWINKVVQGLRPMPSDEQTDELIPDELKVRLLLDRHDEEAVGMSQSCEASLRQYASRYQKAMSKKIADTREEENKPPLSTIASVIAPADPAIGVPQGTMHVKRLVLAQNVTQILASEAVRLVTEHHFFQMLQLDFKSARRKRKSKYNWQVVVALFVALLFVQVGYMTASGYAYENAYTELRQENIKTFKTIFPSVKRIRGSLRRAMDSQLAKNQDLGGGTEFLDLVMITGQSLSNARGLVIKKVTFDAAQGGFKVDLQVTDYPDLEKIQKSIEAQSLQVTIDGANKDKEGVKARLRIGVS